MITNKVTIFMTKLSTIVVMLGFYYCTQNKDFLKFIFKYNIVYFFILFVKKSLYIFLMNHVVSSIV